MRNGTALIGAPVLNRVPIGGGGFVTCVDTCPVNGRVIIGCDTSPAQWRDLAAGGQFQNCLTPANTAGLGIADFAGNTYATGATGACGVAIAPSNPAVMMMLTLGYLLRTTDSWATASKCHFNPVTMDPNGGLPRTWNPRIAIHPTDPNTFIFGTQLNGAYYSTDGGATAPVSTGIGAGTTWHGSNPSNLVCFDPTAPANVYVSKNGTGIYRSTAGVTGTWTLLSGSPAHPSCIHVSADGHLYVIDNNTDYGLGQTIWKLARGSTSWTQLTMPAGGGTTLTSNPSNANHLVMAYNDANNQYFSFDAGATWTHCDVVSIDATNNGLTWLEAGGFFSSQLSFNAYDGKVYHVQGRGIVRITPPGSGATSSTPWVWEEYSLGNEMLGILDIFTASGIDPIVSVYDKALMRPHNLRSPDARPIVPGSPVDSGGVTHAFSTDYEPGNTQHLVSLVDFGGYYNGYNNNGGAGFWPLFAAPAHPDSAHLQVVFTALSGNFVQGAALTGGTSGATGTIALIHKYGGVSTQTAGLLLLSNVTGTFVNGEAITGAGGGSASINDYPAVPAPYGGMICRTGPTQMIWCPGNNGRVVRTTDFGATWIDLTIGGVTPVMEQNSSQWLKRLNFASDKEQPGHVAFIGRNEGAPVGGLPLAAIWHSTDHGATWTKKTDAHPLAAANGASEQFWGARLLYVPGHASKLLYTDGDTGTNYLVTSDDDGLNWSRLGGADSVHAVWSLSFGKGLPGSTWPGVVFAGVVNGQGGVFVSYDMFATTPVTLIDTSTFWLNSYQAICGDMNVLGRIWVGLGGNGLAYYDFKDVRALT